MELWEQCRIFSFTKINGCAMTILHRIVEHVDTRIKSVNRDIIQLLMEILIASWEHGFTPWEFS